MPLAVIAGTALRGTKPIAEANGVVWLQRHGAEDYRPPHLVDHVANLEALAEAGCDRVLAISSVGSLSVELGVGTFVCPDDLIALHLGISAFDDQRGHRVPGFDREWRDRLVATWAGVVEAPLRDGGVYWQAIGPRFETPAEIRMIAPHADVIGMTVASESIVATELGLPYAAICMVDNLANGIGPAPLSEAEFAAAVVRNRTALVDALRTLLPALALEEGPG
jgi:5'-methylthioinosine phosphorylase